MSKHTFLKTIFSKTGAPILIIIGMLAMFTVGLFLINSYWGYQKALENSMSDNQSLAIVLEQYTDTQFKSADLALWEVTRILPFFNLREDQNKLKLSAILDEMINHYVGIESLGVADRYGKVVANTDWENAKHINIKDRQYFMDQKNSAENNLIFSEPVISRATGNKVVIISRKLYSPNGEFYGIVLASLNLKKLIETFISIGNVDSTGSIALINLNRTLLARIPFVHDQIGRKLPDNPVMSPMIAKGVKEATFISNSVVDGVSRIFTYRQLKNFPLIVTVGKDKQNIILNWQRYTVTTGIIGIIFISLIFIALYKYFNNLYEIEKQRIIHLNASKMSSISAVAAGIAHEINNPLTIVSGKSMKIIADIERDQKIDKDKLKKDAQKIHETCFRIAKVVQGLKLLSLDSKHDTLKKNKLSDIIGTALDLSQERLKAEGVNIEVDIVSDLNIHCRKGQLSQVLLNLINYSFEEIKNKTEKWINIKCEYSDDKNITIALTSSHTGMPSSITEVVNAPIFDLRAAEKNIGIDLSVSKTIIESLGGEFSIDKSSPYTRFIIKLYT